VLLFTALCFNVFSPIGSQFAFISDSERQQNTRLNAVIMREGLEKTSVCVVKVVLKQMNRSSVTRHASGYWWHDDLLLQVKQDWSTVTQIRRPSRRHRALSKFTYLLAYIETRVEKIIFFTILPYQRFF